MGEINLSSLATAADPGEAMKKMDGTYEDNAAEGSDQMSRLPQASMPQGTDPKPFTLGEKAPTQR